MKNSMRSIGTLFLIGAVGCKSQSRVHDEQPASAASQPAGTGAQPSTPTSQPGQGAGAATAPTDDAASQLARKVVASAGGGDLGKVAELKFRFVVYDGTTKRADIEHRWDLRAGRDRVIWTDKNGVRRDATVDLATKEAEGTVDGKAPDAAGKADLSKQAYGRWVNDSYWLLMPVKLLDPGVNLAREAPREHGGKKYEILKLSFGQVGLTPGDNYWLFVDPDAGRVERWEMKLEGNKGDKPPPGSSWTDYRAVGPLHLAMNHVNDDGKTRIVFEDVSALTAVEKADFDSSPAAGK